MSCYDPGPCLFCPQGNPLLPSCHWRGKYPLKSIHLFGCIVQAALHQPLLVRSLQGSRRSLLRSGHPRLPPLDESLRLLSQGQATAAATKDLSSRGTLQGEAASIESLSSLGAAAKRKPLPPMVPVSSTVAASQPPSEKTPKKPFSAAGYLAQRAATHFSTAGWVVGAIFDDALDQRGLPTPLEPQLGSLPDTVASTVPDGPQPIISLDPGIEDDDCSLFRDNSPLGPIMEGLSPLRESDMEF